MLYDSRAWAQVDCGAIAHNMRLVRDLVGDRKVMAIVKADAYGHGALAVSRTLLENGANCLGVACVQEARELREGGISAPIYHLGACHIMSIPLLFEYNVIPSIFCVDFAKALSNASLKAGRRTAAHIKIDTGMNRLGFLYDHPKLINHILNISKLPGLDIEGIFTHFISSDTNAELTRIQFEKFMDIVTALSRAGLDIPLKHCANSSAVLLRKYTHLDMVRPGIMLYGHGEHNELMPAMSLFARILHIKEVLKDQTISYDGIFRTNSVTKVATIPIGYADGYSRSLTGKAFAMVKNKKVPVIGRICMDQCMIDVTSVNNIHVGDRCLLFGRSNQGTLPVEEVANLMGTINYEVLCAIGKRIPRVYI